MTHKAYIYPIEPPFDDNGKSYLYNVQILHSLDGEDYYYCGHGRFCETLTEAKNYAQAQGAQHIEVVHA